MKDLPQLVPAFYRSVFKDLNALDSFQKDVNLRSAQYILQRIECEGLCVVSRSLPSLGKAVEKALITGTKLIVPASFAIHWRSALPNFMFNYMSILFDKAGSPLHLLRSDNSPNHEEAFAFWAIRQVTMAFSKARDVGCMVSDDEALMNFQSRITGQPVITAPSWLLNRARALIKGVIGSDDRLDPSLEQWLVEPYGRHGPGAVAGKERGPSKWAFRRIPGTDPRLYMFRISTFYNGGIYECDTPEINGSPDCVTSSDCAETYTPRKKRTLHVGRMREPLSKPPKIGFGSNTPDSRADRRPGFGSSTRIPPSIAAPIGEATDCARSICVPKDFRSPRVICIEPKEFQFAQQGIWEVLENVIRRNSLTRRSINFRSQDRNAKLCKESSVATIDLKDASDLVSLRLCRILFPKRFFELVTRYRSRALSIKGKRLKATCFASMGSALCFPIETLVFWAVAQAAIHPNDEKLPMRVFGDDIIVPKGSAMFVVKMLEACGFKVNADKTCIHTPIRESCGAYTYDGLDVRVTRFKTTACRDLPDWQSLYRNGIELHSRQLSASALSILELAKNWWHVPFGHDGLPSSLKGFGCQSRWNSEIQQREFRLPVLHARTRGGQLSGYQALYAWLVGNSTKPESTRDRKVKVGWAVLER